MIDSSRGRPRSAERATEGELPPPERSRAQPAPRAPRAPRASSRSRSPAHCSVHPLQRARAAPRTAAHTSPRPAPPADGTRRSSRLSAPRARARLPTTSSALASPSSGRTPSLLRTPPMGTLAPSSRAAVHNSARPPVLQRRARRSTLSPCTAPSAHSPFPGNRARFVAGRRRRRLR